MRAVDGLSAEADDHLANSQEMGKLKELCESLEFEERTRIVDAGSAIFEFGFTLFCIEDYEQQDAVLAFAEAFLAEIRRDQRNANQ